MFFQRLILADHTYFTAFGKVFNNFPEIKINFPFYFKSKFEINFYKHSGDQVMNNIFKSIRSIQVINVKEPIGISPFGMLIENRIHDF